MTSPAVGHMEADGAYDEVPVELLLQMPVRSFPVYTRTGDSLVLFADSGEALDAKHCAALAEHGRDLLYIRRGDRKTLYSESATALASRFGDVEEMRKNPKACDAAVRAATWTLSAAFEQPLAESLQHGALAVSTLALAVADDDLLGRRLVLRAQDDPTRPGHSVSVAIVGTALARRTLGLSEAELKRVACALAVHDIGLTQVPKRVLEKSEALSPAEWQMVRNHPTAGVRILDAEGMRNEEAVLVVGQHHERSDGSGYPRGLKGGQLEPLARIAAIADAFAALTADRPHRPKVSTLEALQRIKAEMLGKLGTQVYRELVMLFADPGEGLA